MQGARRDPPPLVAPGQRVFVFAAQLEEAHLAVGEVAVLRQHVRACGRARGVALVEAHPHVADEVLQATVARELLGQEHLHLSELVPWSTGLAEVDVGVDREHVGERIEALRLYLRLRGTRPPSGRFRTFDGLDLPGDPSDGGLGNRVAWLPLVWQGKLRLYGVLPRTSEQLDALDADWRGALRHSPAGVFSYADCQGCHSPGDPEEALHAVYQASLPPETLAGSIASFARGLRSRDLNRSTA